MTSGREYLRISDDRTGTQRSIGEQHAENATAAGARGVTLGLPYQDGGSASRFARKERNDFARLLADLRSGAFAADELWMWESSRGSRKVGEWATLIDVCEEAGVLIHVTTHNHTYDPRNPRDRRSLQEDAIDSEYESAKSSLRIKRTAAAQAALGRPHGKVPYGYRRTYDRHTRKMMGQEPEPTEAAVVVRLFELIRQGHTLNSIAKTFEDDGIRSRTGKVFRHNHLRGIALNATYAGLRVHAPGIEKHPTLRALPKEGVTFTEATWPGLVSRATWQSVVTLLTDPTRTTRKPGGAKHLLSGIAICDATEEPLSATGRRKMGPAYQCPTGCVMLAQGPLDDLVDEIIIDYLARPDVRATFLAAREDSPTLTALRAALVDARARLQAAYASAATPGGISSAALAAMEPVILGEITTLEKQEASLAPPSTAIDQFVSADADVRARWTAATIAVRREVARALLRPDRLGRLRIMRRPEAAIKGFVAVPVEERIRWERQ